MLRHDAQAGGDRVRERLQVGGDRRREGPARRDVAGRESERCGVATHALQAKFCARLRAGETDDSRLDGVCARVAERRRFRRTGDFPLAELRSARGRRDRSGRGDGRGSEKRGDEPDPQRRGRIAIRNGELRSNEKKKQDERARAQGLSLPRAAVRA